MAHDHSKTDMSLAELGTIAFHFDYLLVKGACMKIPSHHQAHSTLGKLHVHPGSEQIGLHRPNSSGASWNTTKIRCADIQATLTVSHEVQTGARSIGRASSSLTTDNVQPQCPR